MFTYQHGLSQKDALIVKVAWARGLSGGDITKDPKLNRKHMARCGENVEWMRAFYQTFAPKLTTKSPTMLKYNILMPTMDEYRVYMKKQYNVIEAAYYSNGHDLIIPKEHKAICEYVLNTMPKHFRIKKVI